jgi:hypothetical protein
MELGGLLADWQAMQDLQLIRISTLALMLHTQVDDRLNGDGTGLPFGINDSALGFVIVGVFTVVWAIWYTAQKDLVSCPLCCLVQYAGASWIVEHCSRHAWVLDLSTAVLTAWGVHLPLCSG